MSDKKVNIINADNSVSVANSNNRITVIDTNLPANIEITQPVTSVIEVKTLGPKGADGIQGIQGIQGIPGDSIFTPIVSGSLYSTLNSIQITGSFSISGSFLFNVLDGGGY